ncbi:type VI secretion system baseplate subunit TssG [Serratia sp. DD3]|uniref:type VI secretion system baseplate subunit TssG n=1 Tax=Serratia sp. DD3 TaxID=1410619 RepID=UPI0003C505AE|nr:type VI secretion system baseplate subunit TssG [Serratia sp. DD3]KEY58762.1 type VI secretion protein, family [Serratia sp. DD3]
MSAKMPRLRDDFWTSLTEQPYEHDLFQILRLLDAQGGFEWPLGRAPHPYQEPIRLGQQPSLSFAPATLASAGPADNDALYHLMIYSFGLFGPNGPLPLHFTEYVRERYLHHQDRTLLDFLNLFHHRLILLFYRAWANSQPTVSLDREDDQAFTRYISSLTGMGGKALYARDNLPTHAKYFMAGHLVRQRRNSEGLAKILRHYFQIPVRILENIPVWLAIAPHQQTRLSSGQSPRLGREAFLGQMVRDVQHKFRIELGPMSDREYRSFLPGQPQALALRDWVRQYLGIEYIWDVRLILHKKEVSRATLGGKQPLGLRCWLRDADQDGDVNELIFSPEPIS